ncbi:hypothetical protein OG413_13920 [Streptomyces sp. NBC_01433]|uniref:hypothetical protein n=1 Tax=Streptomyces sp. NBC_01433 TaxID=2903864 RepID=UPI00225670ED|nr:hypothetical protein [Streptomyces sp. NBC_01433]MCX4676387.1 hypothetical protein [Streptomyces sp. NBC_01433]
MVVTRRALLVLSAAAAMVATAVIPGAGTGGSAAATPVAPGREAGPQADVSHHGHVSLSGDRLGVWLRSENRGPADLTDATVRLRFSDPFSAPRGLPPGCLRGGSRAVLCGTGALTADGQERRTAFDLRLAGRPAEVVVRIDTVWNGGAVDRDPRNNVHEVLAPSTGDAYVF